MDNLVPMMIFVDVCAYFLRYLSAMLPRYGVARIRWDEAAFLACHGAAFSAGVRLTYLLRGWMTLCAWHSFTFVNWALATHSMWDGRTDSAWLRMTLLAWDGFACFPWL